MGENNENLNELHDLLYQIKCVDLPGTDTPNPDEGGAQEEAKDQAEENAMDYLKSQDQIGAEYMDRSNATEYDYLDYGRYINQSLSTYSIPCPYTGHIDFDFKETSSKVKVVNTLLDLLNQRQQSKEFILEAQDVIQDLQVQKRDKDSRIAGLTKECNNQKKQLHAYTSKLRAKDLELRKKEANLNDKIKKLVKEKQQLEFRSKQHLTEVRKKDKQIQELKQKTKSLMDVSEKRQRVTLGMRALNDDLVLRRIKAKNERNARSEEFSLLKQELGQFKELNDKLTTENQNLRHDLMTLRLEVRQALLGACHDPENPYEDGDMHLDVDPHVFEMPYELVQGQIRTDVRKDLNKHKKEEKRRKLEGSRSRGYPHHTDDTPGGEIQDNPGPIPDHIGNRREPGQRMAGLDGLDDLGDVPDLDIGFDIAQQNSVIGNDPLQYDPDLGMGAGDLDEIGNFGKDLVFQNYGKEDLKF